MSNVGLYNPTICQKITNSGRLLISRCLNLHSANSLMETRTITDVSDWHHVKIPVDIWWHADTSDLVAWLTANIESDRWQLHLTIEDVATNHSHYNFYFQDVATAVLFKLTWG